MSVGETGGGEGLSVDQVCCGLCSFRHMGRGHNDTDSSFSLVVCLEKSLNP